jgi:autotransporter-associated beta strand protein
MIDCLFRILLVSIFTAISCAELASSQTLVIHDDRQTHASIASTTVTLSGHSELWITGAASSLSGSVIHLNSSDSWLFLPRIRPSVVHSSYLSQVRVQGAAAVLNTNCRIVQHGDGSVVIPHSPTYAPMEVFAGSNFTGDSLALQNYVGYDDGNLGGLANRIRSFKLKRGYMATIAQNSAGTGVSRNYVAQDGDVEVSVLPPELMDSVSFVRIFPWRWVGKKGTCDIAPGRLDARWHYNWNNSLTSPLDWEYVPIRQQRWWPDYPNQKRESTHVLGYNEPDNPVEDAYTSLGNGSVDAAIAAWPELLASGLRLGSPAVTDGGLAWLYEFIDKADAAKLRVDFVAVHFYRCGYSAQQLYDWLYAIHLRTGRKLWVTEFNNGANWTSCADPTFAQNATAIASFIEMMDNAPFIERYAVYSAVEDVRRMVDTAGNLTPAGVNYQANESPVAYSQVIPEVPTSPAAQYPFENDARDRSGHGHPAMLQGGAKFGLGRSGQAVALSGAAASGDFVQLSSRLGDCTDFTFGAWVYPTSNAQWQRIFDLGDGTSRYLFLTPVAGSGNLRFAIKNGGEEQQLNHSAPLPLHSWSHVAVTLSGNTGKLFVNGTLVNTHPEMTLDPLDVRTTTNFLGKSQFPADPLFAGRLDEVVFLPEALSEAGVAAMLENTPPEFSAARLDGGAATQGAAFGASIAGAATDADEGDELRFSKVHGPSWLTVAAEGTLGGTPSFDDMGIQEFIVAVTDRAGASATAVLVIELPTISANGTWGGDLDGRWNDGSKWLAGLPANGAGFTADFSTVDLSIQRIVNLDADRTIGRLLFGDVSGSQNWILTSTNGHALTLAMDSGIPSIQANRNTATITTSLRGSSGFTKSGAGTLVLKGNNPITGTLNVDNGSSSANDGVVCLANPNAARELTGISIRNNNGGHSTLELDGTAGGVGVPATAAIVVSGRNGTVPAIRNLVGGNTIGGPIALQTGGGNYLFQVDAGQLTLNGGLTSAAAGSRTVAFTGSGDLRLNGVISNGNATGGLGIVKLGTGNLTLSANNSHTGPLAISGGSVTLSGGGTRNEGAINLAGNSSLNIHRTLTQTGSVSGHGTIYNTGSNAITGDFSGFSGSYSHDSSVVSTAFNAGHATSRLASYQLLSPQGSSQGFIAGGNGDYVLEMGALNGVAGSLFRGGNTATGTTTLRVGNLNGFDTFAGSIANGVTKVLAFHKVGSGTMTLSGTNTYTGGTLVSGGMLQVNGSLGTGSVTVAALATLGGHGVIGSNVVVQAGGALAPGSSGIGKLTVNANVSMQADSVTQMEIHKANLSHDVLMVAGTLNFGGTLSVTLLDGELTAGDRFRLFEGDSRVGNFSSITLPTLTGGLRWDTRELASGTLGVIAEVGSYASWAANYPLPVGASGFADDADHDGVANAMEWLLGSDPLSSDPSVLPQASVRELDPAEFPAASADKTYLTLTAKVRKSHPGASLVPQATTSLELLDEPESTTQVLSYWVADHGEFEERIWIYPVAIEDSPSGRAFMRLKLVNP